MPRQPLPGEDPPEMPSCPNGWELQVDPDLIPDDLIIRPDEEGSYPQAPAPPTPITNCADCQFFVMAGGACSGDL